MENERKGGTKKYSTTTIERRTAKSPGPVPPNHALAITAPKNRNRKGYGKRSCTSSVETSAQPRRTGLCRIVGGTVGFVHWLAQVCSWSPPWCGAGTRPP